MHQNKGKTIRQCLSDRLDHGKNPDKTQEGQLISTYACDPQTADAEFALSKREYFQLTGRRQDSDVIAYQVRQSFRPGEITPEEANRIGYEFAERFLKGDHAFIVCTHVDKHHIHNHIYWNSTSLDCTRKFRNFWGSTMAIRKLSDLICVQHRLSVIQDPKPHGISYNRWQGDIEKLSYRDRLCLDMDAALVKKPHDFDGFISLMEQLGYTVRRGKTSHSSIRSRSAISVCAPCRRSIRRMRFGKYWQANVSIIQGNAAVRWQNRKSSLSALWRQNRIRDGAITTICLSRIKSPNSRPGRFCMTSSTGSPAQMILRHLPNRWML